MTPTRVTVPHYKSTISWQLRVRKADEHSNAKKVNWFLAAILNFLNMHFIHFSNNKISKKSQFTVAYHGQVWNYLLIACSTQEFIFLHHKHTFRVQTMMLLAMATLACLPTVISWMVVKQIMLPVGWTRPSSIPCNQSPVVH